MNKTFAVLIIIAAMLIGGILVTKKKNPPIVLNEQGGVSGNYSIQELLTLNQNLKCDFRKSDQNYNVTGSVVLSGGLARGDFDIETSSSSTPSSFASHFILRDNFIYNWTSLLNVGYKSTISADDSTGNQQGNVVSVGAKMDYACEKWNADLTRFILPSGIIFKDLLK